MDSFPNGTNAVVAVISYTGYDMEDAMILNKSAHERGFGYGSIYKSQVIDLKDIPSANKSSANPLFHFGLNDNTNLREASGMRKFGNLDVDGLPFIGARLNPGDPIAAYIDDTTGRTRFINYKGDESCYVSEVRLLGKRN